MASLIQTRSLPASRSLFQLVGSPHWIVGNSASASVHWLYTRNQIALWVKSSERMYGMKSFTQNSDSTTKWLTPDIVHYIVDRERFQTQL